MLIRAVLILALLTQQLAVWPCVMLCRMIGDCGDGAACIDESMGCASACGQQQATSCVESPCTATPCASPCEAVSDSQIACECGPIGYLACASIQSQPLEQGQPSAPAAPAIADLMHLLALLVAFITLQDHSPSILLATSAGSALHSLPSACPPRCVLCCWLI